LTCSKNPMLIVNNSEGHPSATFYVLEQALR
jgi:hypothetical protein